MVPYNTRTQTTLV